MKNVKVPVYPKSISFHDCEGKMKNTEKNKLDENFIKAVDDFSYASASKLLSGSTKNINYSPISLYIALSVAAIGARNLTQDEIFSALGTTGRGIDYLSNQNSKLFKLLYCYNKIYKLKIANSIWLQKNMKFKKTFIDNAVDKFYASTFNVYFGGKSTSKLMSRWISQNTGSYLLPDINLNKTQILSIINTINYKNEWMDKFDKNKTKSDIFYLPNGREVKCDFMNRTYMSHGFMRGSGFTYSYLQLKNGENMIFVLPDKGISAVSLISTFEKTAAIFQDKNSTMGKVIFKVPKFSYGSSIKLNDALKAMGINAAFKINADFSGMTDGTAYMSNINQQSHIAIDENGVEAAAFTQVSYSGSALIKDKVVKMILDRPFIFAIKSYDRILFIGVVNNPCDK